MASLFDQELNHIPEGTGHSQHLFTNVQGSQDA
jgi:hypothetical protein